MKLDFWSFSCLSLKFLLTSLNKTFLEFFCYTENAYHFLINPSYNSYGFGPRDRGTFQRQRARKGLVVSEAGQRCSPIDTSLSQLTVPPLLHSKRAHNI